MFEWNKTATGSLIAKTSFACLWVFGGDGSYSARVETVNGAGLCARGDLPTVDEARSWCEATYVTILQEEIARLA